MNHPSPKGGQVARAGQTALRPTSSASRIVCLHDSEGHAAFVDELEKTCPPYVALQVIDAHIKDAAFVEAVLARFEDWLARGIVQRA